MDYLVVGPDGQEYGPANLDTLKQWVTENRLGPQSMLKDFQTGQMVAASAVPGLFPAPVMAPPGPGGNPMSAGPAGAPAGQNWAQPPNYYQRGPAQGQAWAQRGGDSGTTDLLVSIAWAALAIVLFFALHGIGVIVGVYGVMRAFRAQQKGHRLGFVAIAISVVALVAVIIGWVMRLNGTGV